MLFKNFLLKTINTASFLIFGILFSSALNSSSWAMQNNSDTPQSCDKTVQSKPKMVNRGWNQKQIDNIALFFPTSTNVQKNEVKIEEPSLKATLDEAQKLPVKALSPNVNKGWNQIHPDLIVHFPTSSKIVQKNEPFYEKSREQNKAPPQGKGKIIPVWSSSEEESNNGVITIDTLSEEDFIESSEEDYLKKLPKKKKFKRLKIRNRKYEDLSSSSESTSSYSSDCSSEDKPSTPSIDEDFEPSHKKHKSVSRPIVTTRSSNKTSKRKNSSAPSFVTAVESEEEDDFSDRIIPYPKNTKDFNLVTTMGTRLKLLANVYLANLEGRANIFLPHYTLEVEHPDGAFEIKSFFETPKGEICVFASGGLHHIWEKNIGHIHKIFFGEKVKIIRSHWMQKHLQKDRGIERNLEEEFTGREHELHSEFYYDLFFRHFFAPELSQLATDGVTLKRLTIHAFSWWDVCNHCEDLLSNHKPPEEANFELSYKIAARKRYNHTYPYTSIVEDYALPKTVEEEAWKSIWAALSPYTAQSLKREEKEIFWTKTKDGLEISKWLGQAFRETLTGLDGKAKVAKKGDILAFYKAMQPKKTQALEDLLSYLQDKNWDLSCWYRGPNFPSGAQPKWKRHWKHQIVPHFGWERVTDYKIKEKNKSDHCEMCGYDSLMNVHLIFHPKFHASNKFLNLPEEDQKLRESDCGYTFESRVCDFPLSLKQKRKQSLSVGSECIKALCFSREVIEEWHDLHPEAEVNTKWEVDRLASYDALDMAERNLKGSEKKKRKK